MSENPNSPFIKNNTTDLLEKENDNYLSQQPIIVPKKRGRKKKEISVENIDKLVESVPKNGRVSVEVVKRGRKKLNLKEEPKRHVSKKERILHFLTKDQFQILYPDLRPFKNKKHAIECLLPYHLLQGYKDDITYVSKDNQWDLGVLDRIVDKMGIGDDNIVLDVLRCEEIKYLEYKTSKLGNRVREDNGKVKITVLSTRIKIKVNEDAL